MPGLKGKKKRAQLGQGAFAITYRVVGRAGMEAKGVKAGQVCAPCVLSPENHAAPCVTISSQPGALSVQVLVSS